MLVLFARLSRAYVLDKQVLKQASALQLLQVGESTVKQLHIGVDNQRKGFFKFGLLAVEMSAHASLHHTVSPSSLHSSTTKSQVVQHQI